MKNDAIIFDIDGTLWDACSATVIGWNEGLKKLKISKEVSNEQINKVAGCTQEEAIETIFPGLMDQYSDLLATIDDCETRSIQKNGGVFYRGAIDGIKRLSAFYKIFLVSNCLDWYLQSFFDFSGLKGSVAGFDCHGISGLPKNEMLARLRNKYLFKVPVYVGDTESDEKAASFADMEFIHAAWGFGKPKNKTKSFLSFPDLVDYFIALE